MSAEECRVEDCDRPVHGRGLCNAHYLRWQKNGEAALTGPVRKKAPGRICSVEGCGKPHAGLGFCRNHLARFKRLEARGEVSEDIAAKIAMPRLIAPAICSVEGCGIGGKITQGFCNKHYKRWLLYGDTSIVHVPRRRPGTGVKKHGMVGTREYAAWDLMKSRCTNPKFAAYVNYGGRGISICERWLDFANFYEDMGERPEGMTLVLIDDDGDFKPGNCRWASMHPQKRDPLEVVEKIRDLYYGREMNLAEVGAEIGMSAATVCNMMERNGMPRRRRIKRDQRGPANSTWRGDSAGYTALHSRIHRQRGQPSRCEKCGTEDPSMRYEWANLTGRYEDIDDYARMCLPCHRRYDAERRASTGELTRPKTRHL
jgi:hypothetical protein